MNEHLQLGLPIGTILKDGDNEYEIVDPDNGKGFLGQGGFGITYLAREKRLERDVAIKEFFPNAIVGRGQTLTVTSRDMEEFTSLKKYFLGEARFLAGFDDPRIVKVLAFFEANNTAYMVMPYLSGDTVADRYKKKPFTEAQAKALLLQLIGGLKTVHASGVLHRDIKPDNIKFDIQTAAPILIDFGSARTSEMQGTQSTFGAYSPHFSPIELNSTSTKKTAATDIYALAATTYRTMFQSGPPDAAHRFEQDDDGLPELDIALSKGQISSEFSVVLKRCLELRAKDRFQTLDELEVALGQTSTQLPPVPSRGWAYAVAVALVAGVIGVGAWYSGIEETETDPVSLTEEIQQGEADASEIVQADIPVQDNTSDQEFSSPEEDAWVETEGQNTIVAYKAFSAQFPDSPQAVLAAQRIEIFEGELEWSAARDIGSPQAIRNYIKDCKLCSHKDEAFLFLKELDNAAWQDAEAINSAENYAGYLRDFPNGIHASEATAKREQLMASVAQAADEAAWDEAMSKATTEAFEGYLSKYPQGVHAFDAQDEIAWAAAKETITEASLKEYLATHAGGKYNNEAQQLLAAFQQTALPVSDPHWIRLQTVYTRPDAISSVELLESTFDKVQVFEDPPGAFKITLGPYDGHKLASSKAREFRATNVIPAMAFVSPDLDLAKLVDLSPLDAAAILPQSQQNRTDSAERRERIAAFQAAKSATNHERALRNIIQRYPGTNEAFLAGRLIKRARNSVAKPPSSKIVSVDRDQLVLDCDAVAHSENNPDNPSRVAPTSIIEAKKGLDTCQRAHTKFPEHPRTLANLARSYWGNGDDEAAAKLIQKASSLNYPYGKYLEGHILRNGWGVQQNDGRATELFSSICPEVPNACVWFGSQLRDGRGISQDGERAVEFFRERCEAEDTKDGCVYLGYSYETAKGVSQDFGKAKDLYERSCDAGSGWGCGRLASLWKDGKTGYSSLPKALELFKRGCDQESGWACRFAGKMYRDAQGTSKNLEIAYSLFERACALREIEGCVYQGHAIENGQGLDSDLQVAYGLYEHACLQDSSWGCSKLGYRYEKGGPVSIDTDRAATLYKRGCDGGNFWGCARLGYLHVEKQVTNASDAEAEDNFLKACDGGNVWACSWLGSMHLDDRTITPDHNLADELLEKACIGGNTWACELEEERKAELILIEQPVLVASLIDLSSYSVSELFEQIFFKPHPDYQYFELLEPSYPNNPGLKRDINMKTLWSGNSLSDVPRSLVSSKELLNELRNNCEEYGCTSTKLEERKTVYRNIGSALEKVTLPDNHDYLVPDKVDVKFQDIPNFPANLKWISNVRGWQGLYAAINYTGGIYFFDEELKVVFQIQLNLSVPYDVSRHYRVWDVLFEEGDGLYISLTHEDGYSEATGNKPASGIMYKFSFGDKRSSLKVDWVSALQTSNVNFVVTENFVFTGWGGTNSPDYLYKLDRGSGKVLERTKVPNAASDIYIDQSRLLVQSYSRADVYALEPQ